MLFALSSLMVQNGCLIILMVICVTQYLMHAKRLERFRKKMADDSRQRLKLQTEVTTLQHDRAQVQFENQIFEEFLSQSDFGAAMKLLLKRFVPRAQNGFGAWLERKGDTVVWNQTTGLRTEELLPIPVESEWLEEFEHRDFQILDDDALRHSFIYDFLPAIDRRKVKQLFVFPVRHEEKITGWMITTSLYPAGMALERRISLALRLLNGLEAHFHHTHELQRQESQLKMTRELLELRDITDQYRDSTKELVEAFLSCLSRQVGCDRALIAFSKDQHFHEVRSLQRTGLKAEPSQREQWERDERHLVKIAQHRSQRLVLDPAELDLYGFSEPLQNVVVIPITPREGTFGTLCLMKHSAVPFGKEEIQHIDWATTFLVETLRRNLDLAAIEMQATCDALTGLLNRRVFDERLEQELTKARYRNQACSLLLIDLDHFKSINDTFGHLAGDQVLRRVADTIRTTMGRQEKLNKVLVARYGGEELAVILPSLDAEEARKVGEALRRSIEALDLEFKGLHCPVTASVGVATLPTNADNFDKLIDAADKALYQAKEQGRNRVCLSPPRRDVLHHN